MGDTFSRMIDGTVAWLKTPFNSRGSALNWLAFVGLLIVAVWFWQVVLLHIQDEI